jgi:hypothetical protein
MLTNVRLYVSKQLGAWSYAGVCTHAPTSGGRGLGVDGVSDFNALHSGKDNEKVQLCAYLDALPRLTGPILWAGLRQPRTARARSYRSF